MLTRAGLRYYAPINALVVLGVAVAVAVLAGALLVGASVRESLRQIALNRIGATDIVVTAPTFFRTKLAADVLSASGGRLNGTAPIIAVSGAVTHDASARTAGRVMVYGIDESFARFHGLSAQAFQLSGREALVSAALAAELAASAGDGVTLRIAKPSDIPLSTLQGRREATGQRIRLTVKGVLDASTLGEFSLSPSQGPVNAIYLPLERLQHDLALGDRVNTMLLSVREPVDDAINELIVPSLDLDDLGLRMRTDRDGGSIVETRAGLLTDALADGVRAIGADQGLRADSVLAYVANTIRIGDREVPYSVIAAKSTGRGQIRLNQWAASDLGAKVGDQVTLEYYLWSDEAGLTTARASFTLASILPMSGDGADATLTPEYPGISDAADIRSWDPPFPVDLKRVRKKDEDYWDQYRGAPKAIISLEDGQRLWGSRYGKVSSVRFSNAASISAPAIDGTSAGLTARSVRADALAAAEGTTDFGEYFLYFSFFLVIAALLLAYLFFAVGLEQRTTQVGVLSAIGFSARAIRRAFVKEALILTAIGAVLGGAAAIGYSALILYGLRTWWIGAVGTTGLTLHVSATPLLAGVAGAIMTALVALWLGVRAATRRSVRSLLHGDDRATASRRASSASWIALASFIAGGVAMAAALAGTLDPTAGFFVAGGAWLLSGLSACALFLRPRRGPASRTAQGTRGIVALGFGYASVRPARSVLSLSLVAFATFVLVSVGAFKKDVSRAPADKTSGTGGFTLMAESIAPLMHDPNTRDGRDALGLDPNDPLLAGSAFTRFRLRPGDETSCLTLYRPTNPRIIAPEPRFLSMPRFSFAASIASTPEEHANPWRLLDRTFPDGAIAAVADQTTLMYSLHLSVGDDFTFTPEGHPPITLRIVGALADSMLQSELVIGEAPFMRLFPRHEGYRLWLIDVPAAQAAVLTTHLEDRLSDFGVDVTDTHARWASYHQVENTYLATFQALGSLGLVLGTIGLGAVLARNVLERRRELGLLRAIGFAPADVRRLALAEGMALVIGGLLLGTICALVAILPALRERAQALPVAGLAGLLIAVIVTGLITQLAAIALATRTSVTTAIKSE